MIIPGWEIVQNFIRRQIGVRTDTASSTGSLHAKIGELRSYTFNLTNTVTVASGNLKVSADTERTSVASAYTLIKSIQVLKSGFVRFSFEGKTSATTDNGFLQIYKNGVAFGTERVFSSVSYATYTEDLSVKEGDYIQIYAKRAGAVTTFCRNFRGAYDLAYAEFVVVIN